MAEIRSNSKNGAAGAASPHGRLAALLLQVRVAGRRIGRGIADLLQGPQRCEKMHDGPYSQVVGVSRSKLWSDDRPAEAAFQKGKIHNLQVAVQEVDCALLLPGQVFSFWKQVGRATEERGYVVGRMLQQGCLIPAIGGGLCQLSNALYDAALQSGCEIIERHAHSRVVPGSAAAEGRDATVAWNYIDLRFRSRVPLLIRARVTGDELAISFCAFPGTVVPKQASVSHPKAGSGAPQVDELVPTCATCSEAECFRHEHQER